MMLFAIPLAPIAAMLVQLAVSRGASSRRTPAGARLAGAPMARQGAREDRGRVPRSSAAATPATAPPVHRQSVDGQASRAALLHASPTEERIARLRRHAARLMPARAAAAPVTSRRVCAAVLSLIAVLVAPALCAAARYGLPRRLTWTELRSSSKTGRPPSSSRSAGPSRTDRTWPWQAQRARQGARRADAARSATLSVAPVIALCPRGELTRHRAHALSGRSPSPTTPSSASRVGGAELPAPRLRDVVFLGDHGSTQAGQTAVAGA